MRLTIARLQDKFQGFTVGLDGESKPLLRINGNEPSYQGPILLLSIDQYALFALSRPEVVTRLLDQGPQTLITTKELAHRLFEHGMKACLGVQRFKNSEFIATLKSYYTVVQDYQFQTGLTISVIGDGYNVKAVVGGVTIAEKGDAMVNLDYLKQYTEVPLQS